MILYKATGFVISRKKLDDGNIALIKTDLEDDYYFNSDRKEIESRIKDFKKEFMLKNKATQIDCGYNIDLSNVYVEECDIKF